VEDPKSYLWKLWVWTAGAIVFIATIWPVLFKETIPDFIKNQDWYKVVPIWYYVVVFLMGVTVILFGVRLIRSVSENESLIGDKMAELQAEIESWKAKLNAEKDGRAHEIIPYQTQVMSVNMDLEKLHQELSATELWILAARGKSLH
jgi:hypothetical protein